MTAAMPGVAGKFEANLSTAGGVGQLELAAAATIAGPLSPPDQPEVVSMRGRLQQQLQHLQQQQDGVVRSRREGSGSMQNSRRRGLQSSMNLEEGLGNHWFAVHFTSHLIKVSIPLRVRLYL